MASPQPPKASACSAAVAIAIGASSIIVDLRRPANGMPYVAGGKNTEQDCKEYLWAITAKLQDRDLVGELRQRRCAGESLKKLSLHLIEAPAGPADPLPQSGPTWHPAVL